MTKLEKIIGLVIAGIVVGLLFSIAGQGGGKQMGGIYETNLKYFSGGIDVTDSGDIKVDGRIVIDSTADGIQIGASSDAGCIILGDSAGGASPVYITATGATITASTTKPSACSTAR